MGTFTAGKRCWRELLVLALALIVCGSTVRADEDGEAYWSVIDLGTLGGIWSRPYDMNESGVIVGSSQRAPGNTQYHGWHWTIDSGLVDIGTLGNANDRSKARSINNAGQIVGWSTGPGHGPHAILIEDGVMLDLGTFGGPGSKARGINEAGTIAGFAHDAQGNDTAFIWTPDTGKVSIGTLGGDMSEAMAINNLGQTAGWSHDPRNRERAFFWSEDTGMINLGTLGGSVSYAYGINDSGTVIGDAETRNGERHAFIWSEATGMKDLGTLGGVQSFARGINHRGLVVGSSRIATGQTRAFVWRQGHGMINLNDRIDPASEWTLKTAKSINEANYIVGFGAIGDEHHAYLLVPPLTVEPPQPALAGKMNRFRITGLVPGTEVMLLAALDPGQHTIPACPGVPIDLLNPTLLATRRADGLGNASVRRWVKNRLRGRVLMLQALELGTCRVSQVSEVEFQ